MLPSQSLYGQGPGIFPYFSASSISPSAVAYSMGGGSVAASIEASAIDYNPAALTRLGRLALEGNTFKLLPVLSNDLRFSHVAGAFQISSSTGLWFGAAYTYVNLGEQIITGELDPTPIATFASYERALSFAAAKKFGQHLRLGVGFKYLRSVLAPQISNTSQIGDGRASAYTLDLGLLFDGFLPTAHFSRQFLTGSLPGQKWAHKGLPPGFSLGISLANLELKSKIGDSNADDLIPHMLHIGLAWNLVDSDVVGLMVTGERTEVFLKRNTKGLRADPIFKALFTAWTDEEFDDSNPAFYTAGVEINLLYLGAVRFGHYWDNSSNFDFGTFGFSLGTPGLRFSYATTLDDDVITDRKIYNISLVLAKLP